MGYLARGIAAVGGRRVVLALGGFYVLVAVGFPVTSTVGDRSADAVLIISLLVGVSGLALAYGGYRLPRTNIRPDLYHVVAGWCVRAVEVMVGILLFVSVVTEMKDLFANFLILSALASVAGLGMGYYDGRAKTRAVDAEEYSQELERYRTIVETVDDGIYVVDDDHFAMVNEAYAELLGYDREELVGSHASLVAADAEPLADEIRRDPTADDAGTGTYETTLRTASGEEIEAEATMALLPAGDGDVPDRVGVVRDVTERNERERQLERQNERLDSFASLLAHELRNPVTIGQIYSQQLPREENPQAVEYVTEAFDRIEDMIDVMLLVTRGREVVSESSPVDVADVARQAWAEVDAPEATLAVTTDLTTDVDETYLRHLFRNLFDNAVEHGGSDVTVTVGDLPEVSASEARGGSTDESVGVSAERSEDEARQGAERTAGGFYVADDGRGIGADDPDTVFETGYTSTPDEGGMGLGLAFVAELAEVYEWECSVTESEAGGAQFEFDNVARARNASD